MKIYVYLLCIAAASVVGYGQSGEGPGIPSNQNGSDGYEITILNTFEAPYAANILGMDYNNGGNSIFFIDDSSDKIYSCSADDGTELNSWALDPSNGKAFGIADGGTYAHVNDYSNNDIYFFDGSVWDTYANPYNDDGRGMDFDGSYIWEAFGPYSATYGAVCAFDQSGTLHGSWNFPGINFQLSGLALYEVRADAILMAVIGYLFKYIYFYEFNGTSMDLLGSAQLPVSEDASISFGLTFAPDRNTFFWSYMDNSSVYHISELLVSETSLEHSTWGSIKTGF